MYYAEIVDRVEDILIEVSAETAAHIDYALGRAQRQLELHGFKCLEAQTILWTTPFNLTLGLKPSDWIRSRGNPFWRDGTYKPHFMEWIQDGTAIDEVYNDLLSMFGSPKHLHEKEFVFQVYPPPDVENVPIHAILNPDGTYPIYINYWKRLESLTGTNTSNWFSNNAQDYLIAQTAADCFGFDVNDSAAKRWEAVAKDEYRSIVREDKRSRLGRNIKLRPRTDVNGTMLRGRV